MSDLREVPAKSIPKLIHANLLICEKILVEKDNVFTAVRIADIFNVQTTEKRPLSSQIIKTNLLFIAKLHDLDGASYKLGFAITKPGGEIDHIPTQTFILESAGTLDKSVPRGIVMAVELGFAAMVGTYYVTALLEGVEVARAHFSVIEHKEQD